MHFREKRHSKNRMHKYVLNNILSHIAPIMLLPNLLILKDCEVSLTNVIINFALKCKTEEATKR